MKSKIKPANIEVKKLEFPKLMVQVKQNREGQVVLFSSPTEGVVVYSGPKGRPVGYTSVAWLSDYFEDFDGKVVLSND